MNVTYPPPTSLLAALQIPPVINHLGHQLIKATAFTIIPAELLFFSIYFHLKDFRKLYHSLTALSLITFWLAPYVAPISCGPAKCLQNFASK